MLQDNLERQGINLSLDANLMYWDVNDRYVGINNTTPSYPLDVTGNAHIGNVYIQGSAFTTDTGFKLNLGSVANIQITGGAANTILYTDGTGNLSFLSLPSVISTSGFTGNGIILGAITAGSYTGAETFTANTSVTNAIALLNGDLGNVITEITTLTVAVYANSNVASYLLHNTGNITANGIVANTFSGNINGTTASFTNIYGTIDTANQPYISNIGTLSNLTVTSNVTVGNLTVSGNIHGNIFTDVINPNTSNVVVFSGNTAIGLPSGGTSTRPTGVAGYFRYNSDLATVEYFNGYDWTPLNGEVIDQLITPDGVNSSFTLAQPASAGGLIVSINGTLQQPGIAYTVTGSVITFAEVPNTTDTIDVRFIASVGLTTLDYAVVNSPYINVGTTTTIIDSFSAVTYQSVKYLISSSNGTDSFMAEVSVLQNNGTVVLNTYGVLATGTNTLNFDANVNGSVVNLLATGTTSSNQLRIQRTYFDI
jgi:hypothetical protein